MDLPFTFYAISTRDVASDAVMAPQGCTAHYRETLDIVWSCLATIILCTWVSMHPGIPDPINMHGFGRSKRITTRIWRFTKHRLPLFVGALLAPEGVLATSVQESMKARNLAKKYKLSLTQAFFIVMGGFYRFKRITNAVGDKTPLIDEPKTVDAIESAPLPTEDDETPCHWLDVDQVAYLLDKGMLQMPRSSELQDKSKGDWIAKSLVLIQTIWFIIQCIGRKARHLPLTELEVITLAYTVVNLAIYAIWWEKPYQVEEPVRFYGELPERDVINQHMIDMNSKPTGSSNGVLPSLIRNDVIELFTTITVVISGAAFGAIHFLAWASFFPTPVERLLWRISSIMFTGAPILFIPLMVILSVIQRLVGLSKPVAESLFTWIAGLPYVIARVIILVLAFTTLRRLPPEAYQKVEWSDFLPHV